MKKLLTVFCVAIAFPSGAIAYDNNYIPPSSLLETQQEAYERHQAMDYMDRRSRGPTDLGNPSIDRPLNDTNPANQGYRPQNNSGSYNSMGNGYGSNSQLFGNNR